MDLTAATNLILEFSSCRPTLAILKHTNPCGVGQGATLYEAWEKAFATDRQAPFGGVLAVNMPLDGACAESLAGTFSEVIIAPDFSAESIAVLGKKKNLRLIKMLHQADRLPAWDVRSVGFDSFLGQERDRHTLSPSDLTTVTKRQPTEAEPRVADRQACQIQCRRLCWIGSHARNRSRADEPCRFQPDRRLEGS